MKKLLAFTFLFLLIFGVLATLVPSSAEAAGLVPCGGTAEPSCSLCHGFVLVKNILDIFLFPTIPIIAALLIAVGGFFMLTGAASPQNLSRGRTIILAVVIGVLIIYGSWLFINLLLSFFGVTIWTGPGTWWEIPCPAAVGPPPPPVVNLSASSGSIVDGDSLDLTWSVSNATICAAAGDWSGSKTATGGIENFPSVTGVGTKVYILDCTGPGGPGSDTVFVTVSAFVNNPPTVAITAPASGLSFVEGTNITFTGTATDPEDGNITPGLSWNSDLDGSIGSGGSFSISTLSVGAHTITASVTDSGSLSGSDSITVIILPPMNVTLNAAPLAVQDGDPTTLSWTVTGNTAATTCQITSADPAWTPGASRSATGGPESVTPVGVALHTFELTCTDPITGIDTGTATVNVTPPPQCSDGADNDSDGFTDFPADPGCTSPLDNNEADPATLVLDANGEDVLLVVPKGIPVTMQWTVTNATTCTATSSPFNAAWDGAKNPATGSHTQSFTPPIGVNTYDLNCQGPGGSRFETVDVVVLDAELTTVDLVEGIHNSIAIGSDNNPVVAYTDMGTNTIKVAHCSNANCTAATNGVVAPTGDTGSSAHRPNSIARGSIFPIISYRGTGFGANASFLECTSLNCSSANPSIFLMPPAFTSGATTAIAQGSDLFPVIYHSWSTSSGRVQKCDPLVVPTCAPIRPLSNTGNNIGSIAIDPVGGFPVLAAVSTLTNELLFKRCDSLDCSGGPLFTPVDTAPPSINWPSIAIGVGNDPIISYTRGGGLGSQVKFVRCTNSDCSLDPPVTLATLTGAGKSAIAKGSDNLPVVVLAAGLSGNEVKIVKCGDANCAAQTEVPVATDGSGDVDIAISTDGFPVMSYSSPTGLKVLKCFSHDCL
jgi:hypothetical protein